MNWIWTRERRHEHRGSRATLRGSSYRLLLEVGSDIASSATLQAALLTAVNTARRCFLGGVQVAGNLDVALRVPWRHCRTLADAIVDLQGKVATTFDPMLPRIVFGDVGSAAGSNPFAVRATFEGWAEGVIPLEENHRLPREQQEFTPSGVLAGALAVSGRSRPSSSAGAMPRPVGERSAFPSGNRRKISWLEEAAFGPPLNILPSRLWIIGLGHLGQAYLWTLGLLPYGRPAEGCQLVLQDFDALVLANDSTSLLTTRAILGEKKTRAMARWCEERGFQTAICERRFRDNFQIDGDKPGVALCGIDNALGRAALKRSGFTGLSKPVSVERSGIPGLSDSHLPAPRSARDRWGGDR